MKGRFERESERDRERERERVVGLREGCALRQWAYEVELQSCSAALGVREGRKKKNIKRYKIIVIYVTDNSRLDAN